MRDEAAERERKLFRNDLKILAALAAGLMLVFLVLTAVSPPHEGDSSEYASIARNILTRGEIREDIIKDFARRDFHIPHPATSRGAFFPFLVIPFLVLFKKSILTMAVPGAVAYFLLPLLTYICGRESFGRRAAFWAAFVTLFSPQIANMYLLNEPLEPEMFQALFYLLAVHLFLKGRHGLSGLVFGISCLTKQMSFPLLACVVLYAVAFDRRSETLKGALKFCAVAVLVMSPFLIRSQMLFHHPLYSEQLEAAPKILNELYARNMAGEIVAEAYDYETLTSGPAAPLPPRSLAARFANLVLHNAGWTLFGRMIDVGYLQGLIDVFCVFPFLFMLAGLFLNLRERRRALFGLALVGHCAFMLLTPVVFPRYLIPIFPFAFLLAFHGITRTVKNGGDYLAPISRFILITEFVPFLLMASVISLSNRETNNYRQLSHVCEWMQNREGGEGLILGFPYTSLNFLCERPVVAFPGGGVGTIEKVERRFKPEYVYYVSEWKGDRFPVLSGWTPVVSNGKSSLFRVGAGGAGGDDYLGGVDFLDYFFTSRFRLEILPPLFRGMRVTLIEAISSGTPPVFAAVAGWIGALAAYVALFALFLRVQRSGKAWRAGAAAALVALSLAVGVARIMTVVDKFPDKSPDVSVVQLFSFLESRRAGRDAADGPARIATNRDRAFLESQIKSHPDRERYSRAITGFEWAENRKFDRSLETEGQDIVIFFEKMPERVFDGPASVEANRRDMTAYLNSLEGLGKLPGLAGRRSILMNGLILFY